jgi:hypothetical protein
MPVFASSSQVAETKEEKHPVADANKPTGTIPLKTRAQPPDDLFIAWVAAAVQSSIINCQFLDFLPRCFQTCHRLVA